jgi:hypothetical protein
LTLFDGDLCGFSRVASAFKIHKPSAACLTGFFFFLFCSAAWAF